MANKIHQITIGDALFLQLDANPISDGIGYDAPAGSFATTLGGVAMVKLVGGPTRWHSLTTSFTQGGNSFGTIPVLILGSSVDKDLQIIRNNNVMLSFRKLIAPDFDPDLVTFSKFGLDIGDHNVKNNQFYNFSTLISNQLLAAPLLDVDRKSLIMATLGAFGSYSSLGTFQNHIPTANQNLVGDTKTRKKREVSASRVAEPFTGAPIFIELLNLEPDFGSVITCEVEVVVKNLVSAQVAHRKKTFTLKSTDDLLKQLALIFEADDYYMSENPAEQLDFTILLANDPNSIFDQATNTFKNSIGIIGLINGVNYNISVWATRVSLEV